MLEPIHGGLLAPRNELARVTQFENVDHPTISGLTLHDADRVDAYASKATAESTRRAYASDWRIFTAWCERKGLPALPSTPAVVSAFLAAEADAGTASSTIGRRLAAIVYAHRIANLLAPTVQAGGILVETTMRGIRRDRRGVATAKKRAADGDVLRDMLRSIVGDDLRSARDRALLAVGMGGAFRRSELVAINSEHVTIVEAGLQVFIPISKTDKFGDGQTVVIPDGKRIAPVALYKIWIERASITDGPVFRKLTPLGHLTDKRMSDRGVARVWSRRAPKPRDMTLASSQRTRCARAS